MTQSELLRIVRDEGHGSFGTTTLANALAGTSRSPNIMPAVVAALGLDSSEIIECVLEEHRNRLDWRVHGTIGAMAHLDRLRGGG
jgi:hypothetical protein